MTWIAGLASAVLGFLAKIGAFAWAYFSGKKAERGKQSAAAVERARKANEIDENVDRLGDDERERWLYGSDREQ